MKGSDYTTKILDLTNSLVREQNAHNATALELAAAQQEISQYSRARARFFASHPELLPEWDDLAGREE